MKPLTSKQAAILAYIVTYRNAHGVSPSTRDVQVEFCFSSQNAVCDHYKAIIAKGHAVKLPGKARAILPMGENTARPSAPMFKAELPANCTGVDKARWKGYGEGTGLASLNGWIIKDGFAFGVHAAGHEVSVDLTCGKIVENGETIAFLSHTGLFVFMGIVINVLSR